MTFREQFPASKYPLSNELCLFVDNHPQVRSGLKFSNTERFLPIPLIFTSTLPSTHDKSKDEVIGLWQIDKQDNLCPRHNRVCRFKQDFIVNIGHKNQDFVFYSADYKYKQLVRPIKDFFATYGQGGRYYHDGKITMRP
jgi:hypothetical protein